MQNDSQPGNVITPGSPQPETGWKFQSETETQLPAPKAAAKTATNVPPTSPQPADAAVSWTASEFIEHNKSAGWYLLLIFAAVILSGAVYLLSDHDVISTGVVLVVAILFAVVAARRPRELNYALDDNGIHIGEKFYPYASFRSFAVVQEEAVESIWFIPLKRFNPPLAIYFDPDDGENIVNVISQYLPIEDRQLDAVDKLLHRIRF